MEDWKTTIGQIRAVLFEEGGSWSAQCLDYDIAAQAKTFLEIHNELARVLVAHVAASVQLGRQPFLGINAAPQRFWELYEGGLRVESRMASFSFTGADLPPIRPNLRIARSPTEVV